MTLRDYLEQIADSGAAIGGREHALGRHGVDGIRFRGAPDRRKGRPTTSVSEDKCTRADHVGDDWLNLFTHHLTRGRRSGEVEAIEAHDLVPRHHEVTHELLL